MRLILLLIFIVPTISFGQLATDRSATVSGSASDSSLTHTFDVTNTGSDDAIFYWELLRSEDMPEEWAFIVCDAVICALEGVEASECGLANFMSPGQIVNYFSIKLKPYNVAGEHSIEYRLLSKCADDATDDDVLITKTLTFNVSGGSDVVDVSIEDNLLVYPNPTSDRFQIGDDKDITNISVFNIVGKEVLNETHASGQSHDIANLDKGIYLVRMMDRTQDVLKVQRLTKK